MNRARRTRILVRGDPGLRSSLSGEVVSKYGVEAVESPGECLVMLKVRETAKNSLFYLGELLATEAKSRVGGAVGIGIIAGFEPDAARELSIIDAACAARLPEAESWEARLLAEESALAARDLEDASRVAGTRVVFESMDREFPE